MIKIVMKMSSLKVVKKHHVMRMLLSRKKLLLRRKLLLRKKLLLKKIPS
jgi:hypothetical protein